MCLGVSVATPVDWKHGEKCMVVPTLSNEAAKEKFGSFEVVDVPSGKQYIRMTVRILFPTHFPDFFPKADPSST